jgi:hypothetical protein
MLAIGATGRYQVLRTAKEDKVLIQTLKNENIAQAQ